MDQPPRWIPLLFGFIPIVMGMLILGAFLGFVPTEGGRFSAPPAIILALGLGLIVFGGMLWIPRTAPATLKSGLFLLALALVAVVCNWTAFAPQVIYSSSTSLGPISFSGTDQLGGRIVFGLAALAVNAVILATVVGWIHSARGGHGPRAE